MAGVRQTLRDNRKAATKTIRETKATKEDAKDTLRVPSEDVIYDIVVDGTLPVSLIRHESITADQRVEMGIMRDRLLNAVATAKKERSDFTPHVNAVLIRLHEMLGKERFVALVNETTELDTVYNSLTVMDKQMGKFEKALDRACHVCRTACSKLCTCGKASYCCRECQTKDWERHKAAEHVSA